MAPPRRRLIRPPNTSTPDNQQHQRKVQKLRERLARERTALARWQSRLRRAFNAFEKFQKRIARIEKQLRSLLDGGV